MSAAPVPPALGAVVRLLRCPHCDGPLAVAGRTVRCGHGHCFDVARQGYASLLTGDAQTATADTAAMVAARVAFLDAGHLAPLVTAVADTVRAAVAEGPEGLLVDVGAGTGHHLAAVLDGLPSLTGLALDLSAYALRRAARTHPRMAAVRCDVWRPLPVGDGVAAAVLGVFAPRNGPETARVLAPGGALVVVTPTPAHLAELVEPLGLVRVDEWKQERLAAQLGPHLVPVAHRDVIVHMVLDRPAVRAVVGMGPSARHVDPATVEERVAALPEPVPVTAAVTVAVHRRRAGLR